MKTIDNQNLKAFNTFGIDAKSNFFIQLNTEKDVYDFINNYDDVQQPIYFLGSGANTLFTQDYSGTIVHIHTKGVKLIEEDENNIFLSVKAGEIWDDLVDYCVQNNYYGIENLVAIPGTVGAAPIQNIGAYGVEAKDSIHQVIFYDLNDREIKKLSNQDCQFSYRNSIFKTALKNQFLITEVIFKLSKKGKLNLNYGSINDELKKQNIIEPNLSELSNTIRNIRNSKIPDIQEIGNAGSFFKNPIISKDQFLELTIKFPNIVSYPVDENSVKIAAGWLIENANLKSFHIGGAAVHDKQALVLINSNNASGNDVVRLSKYIQSQIQNKYQITLDTEVIFV